jgi:hypothetical protein
MTLPVVYRRRVQSDLAAAFDWYEEQRSGLGEKFLSAAQSTFESPRDVCVCARRGSSCPRFSVSLRDLLFR